MRQSGIPTCIGKDVGRVFLHSPRIRCGGKHGQYFANAGPLYLWRIIVCVLITLQGSRFNDTLPNWRSMDTIMGQNWSETRCCSGRSSTHQQRKRRSGFAIQTPKSRRYKRRKGWWKFNKCFCFLKVILFCCKILLFAEMARKFVNPLSLRIFYLILSGDDSLNNYTNYNTRLKLLQPGIYPARYM